MTAIITDKFRFQNFQYAKRDIDSGVDSYFLAIGRSQDWPSDTVPPTPAVDAQDEIQARLSMQSVKKITNIVPCAPRYNWVNGNTYVGWDNTDATLNTKQYYVFNQSNFNVYICLRAGGGASTVEPTGTATGNPTEGADGYVWKYLYTISAANADKYLTTDFMPVFRDASVAAAATYGQIWDINIVSGGAGYGSAPTVTIEGDGTGATATATVAGGVVTGITITGVGSGYTYARVALSGGSPSTEASLTPIISPVSLGREVASISVDSGGTSYSGSSVELIISGDGVEATATASITAGVIQASPTIDTAGYGYTNATVTPAETTAGTDATFTLELSAAKGGFGYDPVVDLNAYYMMFNVTLAGAEGSGDFIPSNNYRQLMIVKNPLDRSGTQKVFTDTTGTAMPFLDVDSGGTWAEDDIITGGSSGAQAYVDYYDSANQYLYYHQTEETGFGAFTDGETLTGAGASSGAVAASGASNPSEVDNFSGRMVYLENRSPVSRATDQTEDIKLVVQF